MKPRYSGALGIGLYLFLIQFLFAVCWLVYVVYLGDLLDQVGIGKENLPWIILVDQVVFVVMDVMMGFNADRVTRMVGRLGPWIVGINAVSCMAFAVIPMIAGYTSPALFLLLVVVWIASASVLRAPPLVLLSRRASKPQIPWLAALTLFGLALGAALSPYLGLWLKQQNPLLPFVVSAAALWVTTLGLVWAERKVPTVTEALANSQRPKVSSSSVKLIFAALFLGLGFQVYAFFNTKPQFLLYVSEQELAIYLPLFWVGFNMLVFPAAALVSRFGAMNTLTIAAITSILGGIITAVSASLPVLIAGQIITGAGWGLVFSAGISGALRLGSTGREGLLLGLWFSMLSLAAVVRVGMLLLGVKTLPGFDGLIGVLPVVSWIVAVLFLVSIGMSSRREQARIVSDQ
ncbi:MAG: MFS transporter [Candidatus Thiodiazotropha sp.]